MASRSIRKSNEEENNVVSTGEGLIDRVLGDVGKYSATKQLIIGSISGWCTGFISMKVGKAAAFAFGGGIILLQIANHQGYIKVNWDKVCKQANKATDRLGEKAGQGPEWMEKMGVFARKNTYAAAGFVGGVFLGLASS
ncbi:FUN14 domain-containing protein 1 isoform X2 [Cryptotermes secundus]|uniref:FUN14 domain-containing protein 1 isoform X2 n=1 Tax=Cryptotermes secundus TaxID=105785 RepID=UPI000CD7AE8D|nr:FUN14 domain-containing protein 1 isoform X2 [Cryptotermes secundus]